MSAPQSDSRPDAMPAMSSMKPYFFLLCLLWLSSAFLRGWQVWAGVSGPLLLSYVADLAAFAFALRACHGLAFGRAGLARPQARLTYWAVMGAGLFSVLLRTGALGLPAVGGQGP
ncbi:MAG: hypothetical protein AB7D57_04515, partial [Desulfovibrionaceae bacterium]